MIHRPIYLSCDSCGVERYPTPDESRETLAQAFSRARSEGWTIRQNGESIYCAHCMGIVTGPKSARKASAAAGAVPAAGPASKDGVVGLSLVPLD